MKPRHLAWVVIIACLPFLTIWAVSRHGAEDRPFRLADPSAAVGLAIASPNQFDGITRALGPEFKFYVHNDLSWTISFTAAAYIDVKDVVFGAPAEGLPQVGVFLPKDAHNCFPYASRMFPDWAKRLQWSTTRLKPDANYAIFQLKPLQMLEESTQRALAVWSVTCDTQNLNTTPAGIDAYNFELQYLPGLAIDYNLTSGMGKFSDALAFSYGAFTADPKKPRDGEVRTNFNSLDPMPDQVTNSEAVWRVNMTRPFSVRGTVNSWFIGLIEKFPAWVGTTILGFFATAILALAFSWLTPGRSNK
ncbi:hypothetical protein [Mycobacterium sp. 155]|uniref:hypothetical protein n=1 Tax=Mycobacterium sp. 155 TaxID=1157943 RepID=UPI0012FAF9B6|nr:hypothetical protein [Mycobacterium sp. 155]